MEMTSMRSKKIETKKIETKKTKAKKTEKVGSKKIPIVEESMPAEQSTSIENFNNSVETSFFYTNDKYINSLDDNEIINRITSRYPDFNQQNKDTQLKKIFLQLLDDEEFILNTLDYYNIDIYEFFKIIYKNYSALFNTLFIKKVREKIQNHTYAK